MKKLTKYEIAKAIEKLPGNKPWSAESLATVNYDHFTREELVNRYNRLITQRQLDIEEIK